MLLQQVAMCFSTKKLPQNRGQFLFACTHSWTLRHYHKNTEFLLSLHSNSPQQSAGNLLTMNSASSCDFSFFWSSVPNLWEGRFSHTHMDSALSIWDGNKSADIKGIYYSTELRGRQCRTISYASFRNSDYHSIWNNPYSWT